ncbi:hypothetical protein ACHAWX_006038 [Stephanocyclus meneghinianus]
METAKAIDEISCKVNIFGEIVIGNTTTSSTLIAILRGKNPSNLCGSRASTSHGGVNYAIITKKIAIVEEATKYHGASKMNGQPYKAFEVISGAKIAGMFGGMLETSKQNVPILFDGFICSTAAMIACLINPLVSRALLFAIESTEKGQSIPLEDMTKIALTNDLPPLEGHALHVKLRISKGWVD